MLKNKEIQGKLIEITNKFYINLKEEKVENLNSAYNEIKQEYKKIADEDGFDLEINMDRYLRSILQETMKIVISKDEKIKNNIRKKIYTERYIKSAIEICKKEYNENEKLYGLLRLSRDKL